MATFDQMIIDDRELANRYFGGDDALNDDQYLFSNLGDNHRRPPNNNNSDPTGLFGRRVYLESPSLGNRDEEEIYRYVPSRLSEHQGMGPARVSEALIDSLDLELNGLGTMNTRPPLPYRNNPQLLGNVKPPALLTQMKTPAYQPVSSNLPRADPRQDPLLGPLLAELDALTTQQPSRPVQAPPIPIYRRNSVPYEAASLPRASDSQTRSNYALSTTANRTVADALFEAELYDSLDNRDAQIPSFQPRQALPVSAPNLNLTHPPPSQQQQQQARLPPRSSNMNSTDIFMPSSYGNGPGSFLSHFGPEDQLFQQPLLNAIGQNYVPNPRPPPQSQPPQSQQPQYDPADPMFDSSFSRVSPPQRTTYAPPQRPPNNNPYQQQQQQQPPAPPNRQTPHDNMDPFGEYHDMYASSQQQRILPSLQQRPPPSQGAPGQQSYQRPPPQQQQYYEGSKPASTNPNSNREMFFTDHDDDQMDQLSYRQQASQQPGPSGMNTQRSGGGGGGEPPEQDSRRQAVWNELQRNNAKVQEKNAKKRESANRREQLLKGNYISNNGANAYGAQQSSAPAKTGGNPPAPRRPPPVPVSKTNYIDDNIDMIRNKENFYHRYPAKKYENLYSKRKDLGGGGAQNAGKKDSRDGSQGSPTDFDQTQSATFTMHGNNAEGGYADPKHRTSLPVTVNLNPGPGAQTGALPATVTIPLDSHVNRVGDKISVNIDLRLVDLQNLKLQQQQQNPDWSGLDPLDRHIRKLERSIDQSLPQTNSPTQRSPTMPNPAGTTSMGRYGKLTTGAAQTGYAPPSYGGGSDHYSYSDKGREEDSYLAKMNHMKRGPNFKPYNGRDYEQFKKNYGYGGGNLGFDFDNPNYKEKSDKLSKTKEYAQQVEARNKKKLTDAPRRTLSDTRIPTEASKTQRALEYARVSTRHKQTSGASTRSTPPDLNGNAGGAPSRRPTEVLHRPPPVQKTATKAHGNDNNELVERLALRHEQDKAQVHGILHPSQKRREPLFDDDRGATDIERLAQDRIVQRRISPSRPMPPPGPNNNTNGRRPLRFDEPPAPSNEPSYPPAHTQEHYRPAPPPARLPSGPRSRDRTPQRPIQPQAHQQDNVDELASRHNDEKMLMEAIRRELSERPLGDDEELIVVEQ